MTVIEGVDELVNVPGVFSTSSGVFVRAFSRGVRNIYDHVTVSVFGAAAVMAGVALAAGPSPKLGNLTFTELEPVSEASTHWTTGVAGLKSLIQTMATEAPPATAGQLMTVASGTIASLDARKVDADAWATALAANVADLDD